MPAIYDKTIIQQYAAALYKRAFRIIILNALLLAIAGSGLGFFLLGFPLGVIGLAILGGYIGYVIGRAKVFALKLEAQSNLCQVQIECNTTSKRPDGAEIPLILSAAAQSPEIPLEEPRDGISPSTRATVQIREISVAIGIAVAVAIIAVVSTPDLRGKITGLWPGENKPPNTAYSPPERTTRPPGIFKRNEEKFRAPVERPAEPAEKSVSPAQSESPSVQDDPKVPSQRFTLPRFTIPEPPPEPRSVTFFVKNEYAGTVQLFFFKALDRSQRWPGGGRTYILSGFQSETYPLNCTPGEKICYSAWVEGGFLNPYWGAGPTTKEPCTDCCAICSGQTVLVSLDTSRAVSPTPTVTFRVRSHYPYSVAIAFYSATRPGHYWPGNNQVWLIRDQKVHDYRLSCLAGEKICYGAWPEGNPNRYWGAGLHGRQACSNCCYMCDGSETIIYVLN